MRRGLILAAALLTACGEDAPSGKEHLARVRERLEGVTPRDRGVEAVPELGDLSWAKVAPEQIEAARKAGVPVAFENALGMRFVLIPAGTFTMGAPDAEERERAWTWRFHPRDADEVRESNEAQHSVTLTRPFYLGTTEVTNRQYRRFMPTHDSGDWNGESLSGEDQPVVSVSWDDAVAFVTWLSHQEHGRTYRLPTEAEWERACRAGTDSPFWWGRSILDHQANYQARAAYGDGPKGRFRGVTLPVGALPSNPWGLSEIHGNVNEWCADWRGEYSSTAATDPIGSTSGEFRASRGGGWNNLPTALRSAARARSRAHVRDVSTGFRVAASSHQK